MSRRIALGALADGTVGLRVAKSGTDANANPPVPANLIFDSNWPQLLPIHALGQGTVNSGATATINFTALGYVPLFTVGIRSTNGTDYLQSSFGPPKKWGFDLITNSEYNGFNGANSGPQLITTATSSALTIQYIANSGSWGPSLSFCYIIYRCGQAL